MEWSGVEWRMRGGLMVSTWDGVGRYGKGSLIRKR